MVRKFKSKKDILVVIPDGTIRPFYLSKEYNDIKKRFEKNYDRVQFCQFNPFLGIIPLEVSDIYPASHYVMPRIRYNQDEFSEFTKTWKTFFVNNNFKTVYTANDEFLKHYTKLLPKKIKIISISR